MSKLLGNNALQSVLLLALIGLVVVLTIGVLSLTITTNRLKKNYKYFMKGQDGQSLERVFSAKMRSIDNLEKLNAKEHTILDAVQSTQERTLTKYGIVKYDAFDDVGGKMSFALARLDKDNTGYILNAIHSRDNCFLYLKEIVKGESFIMLSDEEIEALKQAVNFNRIIDDEMAKDLGIDQVEEA